MKAKMTIILSVLTTAALLAGTTATKAADLAGAAVGAITKSGLTTGGSGAQGLVGNLKTVFVPVPEPSQWGVVVFLGVVAFIAVRRIRRARKA